MHRRTALAIVVAVLGVLAIALAAATLTSPITPDAGWRGNYSDEGNATGEDIEEPEIPEDRPIDAISIERTVAAVPVLVGLGAFAVLVHVVRSRREAIPYLLGIGFVVGVIWGLYRFVAWLIASGVLPGIDLTLPSGDGRWARWVVEWPMAPSALAIAIGAVLIISLLLATGVVSRGTRPGGSESDDGTTAAIGLAAGRAADRLEGERGYESAVHRAWREMTGLLDVPRPATTTPGEFESAAVDAGMDPAHVRELTRLFEDVRYGGARPTEARERRAIEIFRRIEAEHRREGR